MSPYVMSWQEYTLTLAEIVAWPATIVAGTLILSIMALIDGRRKRR